MKDKVLSWTNRLVSIFLFTMGVFVFFYSKKYLEFGGFSKPKGGFVPSVFSVGLMIFGLISVIQEFSKTPKVPKKFEDLNWKKLGFYYLECILYVFFISKVGFLVDTLIFLFIMLKQCGTRGIVKPLIITVITSVFLWAVFKYAMGIALPAASWF